jgi:hypothetical protein
MQWTCINCGARVRMPDDTPSVRCHCGYVDYRDGTWEFGGTQVARNAWYKAGRQAMCLGCENYMKERCKLIELGCRNAYLRAIEQRDAACPMKKWFGARVPFVATASLASDAMQLADKVPPHVTRVIGVPRSGMIPAAAIATKLQLPLFAVCGDNVVHVGHGTRISEVRSGGASLLVDDTVHSGFSMQRSLEKVKADGEIITAAVYTTHPRRTDLYQSVLPTPHLLEWNLFNGPFAAFLSFDMDGILCHNPPRSEDPLYLARHSQIAAIITARLEEHRGVTEQWLAKYGVRYSKLHMWEWGDSDRNDIERVAKWKSDLASGAAFYIESEPSLANAMRRNGTVVLCPAQGYLE